MAGSKKVCPECGEEFWAMHLPRHRMTVHGIEAVKGTKAVKPDDVLPPTHRRRMRRWPTSSTR